MTLDCPFKAGLPSVAKYRKEGIDNKLPQIAINMVFKVREKSDTPLIIEGQHLHEQDGHRRLHLVGKRSQLGSDSAA